MSQDPGGPHSPDSPQYSRAGGSPYPPYQPYQQYYPGPMAPSTNPWAIASLICSLVGIAILGVIFGHIALGEIKRSNGWQTGYGMALAGLIIGYAEIALGLVILIAFFSFGLTVAGSHM